MFDKIEYKVEIDRRPDFKKLPVNAFQPNEESCHLWNDIMDEIMDYGKFNDIKRSKNGSILTNRLSFRPPMYDISSSKSCVELTVVAMDMFRLQIRSGEVDETKHKMKLSGRQARDMFIKKCKEMGVDIEKYAVEDGSRIKEQIEKPYICLTRFAKRDRTYFNIFHLDFHNSYPGGLCNTHPEFRPVVEYFYDRRHSNDGRYKAVLNYTIGAFQSMSIQKARYAKLSRDAIKDNNDRIRKLCNEMINKAYLPLMINVDGIWYRSPNGEPYHGEGEGDKIGEWRNDHLDCQIRFKSDGAYEYIEDGVYYPVIRGETLLDRVKPRTEWEWGDIYSKEGATVIQYYFDGTYWRREDGQKI